MSSSATNGFFAQIPSGKRYFLIVSAHILIGVLAVFLLLRFVVSENLYEHFQLQQHLTLESADRHFQEQFRNIGADLFLLAGLQTLNRYLEAPDELSYQAVSEDFLNFARQSGRYDQVRLIDHEGNEKIRINYAGGSAATVLPSSLQNKKDRYYFQDSISLQSGEIFVSPLDLNIEHGTIEIPYKPMLRVATPLFTPGGEKWGILILNCFGDALLKDLGEHLTSTDVKTMLVNQEGYWFFGAPAGEEWAFMFGRDERLGTLIPELWESVFNMGSGMGKIAFGLFSFTTITPLENEWRSSTGSPHPKGLSTANISGKEYAWKLIAYTPDEIWAEHLYKRLTLPGMTLLGAALLLLVMLIRKTLLRNRLARALRAEQAARQETEAATRAKNHYIATISHDIRTPMSAIIGMTELLLDNTRDPEQICRLKAIQESGTTLVRLIDDILDVSKIEAGHLSLHPEPLKPSDLMQECLRGVASEAERKGLRLRSHLETGEHEWVSADRTRLIQIISNLLTNAVRYSNEGEIVFTLGIRSVADQQQLHVSVKDSGEGIPEHQMSRIFEPYMQIPRERRFKAGSYGLGLAIVKRLIEGMGGEIDVISSSAGSCFSFWIPSPPSLPPEGPQQRTPQTRAMKRSGNILLAEDHPVNAKIVTSMLELAGHTVTHAADGLVALELLQKCSFDLAVIDINMPEMDGFEVVEALKSDNTPKMIPVIALTAHAMVEDRQRCIDAGFDEYLIKPVQRRDLLELIERYLEGSTTFSRVPGSI